MQQFELLFSSDKDGSALHWLFGLTVGFELWASLPKCLIKGLGVGEVAISRESVAVTAMLNIVVAFTMSKQIVLSYPPSDRCLKLKVHFLHVVGREVVAEYLAIHCVADAAPNAEEDDLHFPM